MTMSNDLGSNDVEETGGQRPKRILFLDYGNTCRSPMAKVILEQKLKKANMESAVSVDSAGIEPTYPAASEGARKAIAAMFGEDLLENHQTKPMSPELTEWADLILAMELRHMMTLPREKTFTLPEYAGFRREIEDPWGGNEEAYAKVARDIVECIDKAFSKIVGTHGVP